MRCLFFLLTVSAWCALDCLDVAADIMVFNDKQIQLLSKSMDASTQAIPAIFKEARDRANQIALRDNVTIPAAHYRAALEIAKHEDPTAQARSIVIHLEQSLLGNHHTDECHVNLGQIYLASGDFRKAKMHLQVVANQRPDLQLKLARIQLVQGDTEAAIANAKEAESKLKKMMRQHPESGATEIHWIATLEFLERFDEAIDHLKRRMASSKSATLTQLLSQILTSKFSVARRSGDAVTADEFETLRRAIELNPANRSAMEWLIVLLPGNNSAKQLKTEFDVLARLADSELPAHAHLVIGSICMQRNQLASADRHLRAAYEANPKDPAILNNYAHFLSHADPPRLDEALRIANELVAMTPNQTEFRETRGQIYLLQENWSAAMRDFQLALPTLKDYPGIHRGLAIAHEKLGNSAAAKRHQATFDRLVAGKR